MSEIIYWVPFGLCVATIVLLCRVNRRIHDLNAKIAHVEALNRVFDVKAVQHGERARDFAEALLLWNHGAQQEAVELLQKWGTVTIMNTAHSQK